MKELKFQIGDIKTIGIVFVITALVLAFGLQILGDVRSDMVTGVDGCNATNTTGCGDEYGSVGDGISAVSTFSGKLGIIATIVVAVILIGLLLRYFGKV